MAKRKNPTNKLDCTPDISYNCGKACIPVYKNCLSKIEGNLSSKLLNSFRGFIDKLSPHNNKTMDMELEKAFDYEKKIKRLSSKILNEDNNDKKNILIEEREQLKDEFKKLKPLIDDYYTKKLNTFLNDTDLGKFETLEEYLVDKMNSDIYGILPKDSFMFLVQLHAEKRLEYNRLNGKVGNEVEEYTNIVVKNLEYLSRNSGEDNLDKLIDSFGINAKDKSQSSDIKNKLKTKIEQTFSEKEFRNLSDNVRKNVLNNYTSEKPPSNELIAKVSWNAREALKSIDDPKLLDVIDKLYNSPELLKEKDIKKISDLYDTFPQDLEPKNGMVLLRISILNKLANEVENNNKFINDELITNIAQSNFFSVLGTNDKSSSKKLYLGDVKGEDNKLFRNNSPFGGKKIRDVISNKKLKDILAKNGLKLIKSEKELIPIYINSDGYAYSDEYNGDNPKLLAKKRFIGLFGKGNLNNNSIDDNSPEILKELKRSLPNNKNYNVNYIGPQEFDNFLKGIANGSLNNIPSNKLEESLLNDKLISDDANILYNKYLSIVKNNDDVELKNFFQKDFLTFMTKLGFAKTEAAEYLPVFYASAKGRSGAVLDLYDGSPFPFADAIVEGSDKKFYLTSIKYGESGGVPADANALTNLLAPEYTKLIGVPGKNILPNDKSDDGWNNLKAENSPIIYTNTIPGIKLKNQNITKEDILNHLSKLSGHFNFDELKRIATNESDTEFSPLIKGVYEKLNMIADLLIDGETNIESQKKLAVIFNIYNIDKMEKVFNAEKVKVNPLNNDDSLNILIDRLKNDTTNPKYKNYSDKQLIEEIKKLNPNELNKKYGFNIKIDSSSKIIVQDYYKHYNLQLGLSHVAMAIWEQDLFNDFFEKKANLIPTENHPDLDLDIPASNIKTNSYTKDEKDKLLKQLGKLNILNANGEFLLPELMKLFPNGLNDILKLIFSNRTDAGSSSRTSSGGTQYKYGGIMNIITILENLVSVYSN